MPWRRTGRRRRPSVDMGRAGGPRSASPWPPAPTGLSGPCCGSRRSRRGPLHVRRLRGRSAAASRPTGLTTPNEDAPRLPMSPATPGASTVRRRKAGSAKAPGDIKYPGALEGRTHCLRKDLVVAPIARDMRPQNEPALSVNAVAPHLATGVAQDQIRSAVVRDVADPDDRAVRAAPVRQHFDAGRERGIALAVAARARGRATSRSTAPPAVSTQQPTGLVEGTAS